MACRASIAGPAGCASMAAKAIGIAIIIAGIITTGAPELAKAAGKAFGKAGGYSFNA